eukprot:TRINITY_DN10963_c0_g1_i1.p1 TRINITY_DN10963_c0_g1~~TRINITY_DN10963_c0_g1_i1.p1  ORF type:complete len:618 (+),score=110.90 TRINITY_DN10963_c0_g1_i1:160-2013(+)
MSSPIGKLRQSCSCMPDDVQPEPQVCTRDGIWQQTALLGCMLFPMVVVRVKDFLAMSGRPPSYDDLLAEGKLFIWHPGMPCVFISHQWLSKGHPDPEGCQLNVLRQAIEDLLKGETSVRSSVLMEVTSGEAKIFAKERMEQLADGYLWLDWFSIPQIKVRSGLKSSNSFPEQENAIRSIPDYVDNCSAFVVLAPPREHADTGLVCDATTWFTRRWCRMELLCRGMSNARFSDIILVKAARDISFMPVTEFWEARICDSEFTAPADKGVVVAVMAEAIRRKEQSLIAKGSMHSFRFLVTSKEKLLALDRPGSASAMPSTLDSDASWHEFLVKCNFPEKLSEDATGFSVLHAAANEDNISVLCAAIGRRLDVNAQMSKAVVAIPKGATPLEVAAMRGSNDALSVLLQARADPEIRDTSHAAASPLCAAVASMAVDSVLSVELLLKGRTDVHACASAILGSTLAETCWLCSDELAAPKLKLLLEARGSIHATDAIFGACAIHWTAAAGQVQTVTLLLEHRAAVNVAALGGGLNATALAAQFGGQLHRWGYWQHSAIAAYARVVAQATPLHLASMEGHKSVCKLLLAARADQTVVNAEGLTPLAVARAVGFGDVLADCLTG